MLSRKVQTSLLTGHFTDCFQGQAALPVAYPREEQERMARADSMEREEHLSRVRRHREALRVSVKDIVLDHPLNTSRITTLVHPLGHYRLPTPTRAMCVAKLAGISNATGQWEAL
jgi:hypothetical protein